MYTGVENDLDKLVTAGLVSEWRWGADKLLVFVNDNMWEEFKEVTDGLFDLDDTGLKAYIKNDYICIELNPEDDLIL